MSFGTQVAVAIPGVSETAWSKVGQNTYQLLFGGALTLGIEAVLTATGVADPFQIQKLFVIHPEIVAATQYIDERLLGYLRNLCMHDQDHLSQLQTSMVYNGLLKHLAATRPITLQPSSSTSTPAENILFQVAEEMSKKLMSGSFGLEAGSDVMKVTLDNQHYEIPYSTLAAKIPCKEADLRQLLKPMLEKSDCEETLRRFSFQALLLLSAIGFAKALGPILSIVGAPLWASELVLQAAAHYGMTAAKAFNNSECSQTVSDKVTALCFNHQGQDPGCITAASAAKSIVNSTAASCSETLASATTRVGDCLSSCGNSLSALAHQATESCASSMASCLSFFSHHTVSIYTPLLSDPNIASTHFPTTSDSP